MKNILYILIIFFFSCGNKTKENIEKEKKKPLLSVAKEHSKITDIKAVYKIEIENWEELGSLNSFFSRFKKISSNEALSNALELKDLVQSLKDSLIPEKFDIPSFKARINILNNEVLRLKDLTYISSISDEEVNKQVDKVISSFSSLKEKINTILSQKQFEDAINIDIDFIGIDSTKIDSISKKSIKNIKEEIETKENSFSKIKKNSLKNKISKQKQ